MFARAHLRYWHTWGLTGSTILLKELKHMVAFVRRLPIEPISDLSGKFVERIETLIVGGGDWRNLACLFEQVSE